MSSVDLFLGSLIYFPCHLSVHLVSVCIYVYIYIYIYIYLFIVLYISKISIPFLFIPLLRSPIFQVISRIFAIACCDILKIAVSFFYSLGLENYNQCV